MSYRSIVLAGALALAALCGAGRASAEHRLALVIGNSAYQSVAQLPNPANDARQVGELLKAAKFEVTTARDLSQTDMRRAINDFARKAAAKGPDAVVLVYYAGHGLQVDGYNYLVPVDASIKQEADVPLQTLRLNDLMDALASAPSKARIVMLDACRNNPLSDANKTWGRGLAIVDAPNGSIVSYAAEPGSEAEDGEGRNSPYASAFLAIAREPGMPIEQALKRVRYAVHQATDGRQTPWESSSLTSDFSFFPGQAETTGAAAGGAGQQVASLSAGSATRSVEDWQAELRTKSPQDAYGVVIREDSAEAYQAYLDLFPNESNTPRVQRRLDRRLELVAWHEAVTVNTPAAYRAFLADYPDSDYAATAQRLVSRTDSRALGANARARVCSQPIRTRRADVGTPERRAALDRDGGTPRSIVSPPAMAATTPAFAAPPVLVRPPLLGGPFGRLPILDKPIFDKPILDKPVLGKPDADKPGGIGTKPPILDKPIFDKPILDKPVLGKPGGIGSKPPILDKPIFDKPVLGKQDTDKPGGIGTKPPILDKPAPTRPVLDKPAILKPQTIDKPRFATRPPMMDNKPQAASRPVVVNRPQPINRTAQTFGARPSGGGPGGNGMGGGAGGGMRFGGGFGRGGFR